MCLAGKLRSYLCGVGRPSEGSITWHGRRSRGGGGGGGSQCKATWGDDSFVTRRASRTRARPQEDKLCSAALLVLANKQDLLTALPPSEVAESLGLFMLRGRAWQIQGCSARDGSGLADGMDWLVRQIAQ